MTALRKLHNTKYLLFCYFCYYHYAIMKRKFLIVMSCHFKTVYERILDIVKRNNKIKYKITQQNQIMIMWRMFKKNKDILTCVKLFTIFLHFSDRLSFIRSKAFASNDKNLLSNHHLKFPYHKTHQQTASLQPKGRL